MTTYIKFIVNRKDLNPSSAKSEMSSAGNLVQRDPKEMESQLITKPGAASTLGSRACLKLGMVAHAYNPGTPRAAAQGCRAGLSTSSC